MFAFRDFGGRAGRCCLRGRGSRWDRGFVARGGRVADAFGAVDHHDAQEQEAPPIARAILDKLGAKNALTDEVCDIIAHHHHPQPDDNTNFKVLYDSDMITNMEERHKETPMQPDRIQKFIQESLLTEGGKEEAKQVFSIS